MNTARRTTLYLALWAIIQPISNLLFWGIFGAFEDTIHVFIFLFFKEEIVRNSQLIALGGGVLGTFFGARFFYRINGRAQDFFVEICENGYVDPHKAIKLHFANERLIEAAIVCALPILFALLALKLPVLKWAALLPVALSELIGFIPGVCLATLWLGISLLLSLRKAHQVWRLAVINLRLR